MSKNAPRQESENNKKMNEKKDILYLIRLKRNKKKFFEQIIIHPNYYF